VVFTDPGGGLVCLCIEAPWSGRSAGFTMRVERHDPVSGATERGVAVLELEDGPSVQAIVQPLQLDVDLAPDGRHLFLASVALESAWWIVRLHVLDASDGTPAGAIVLGAVEGLPDLPGPGSLPRSSPAPPAAASPVWADGPLTLTVPVVQVAPDGGSVRVVAEGLQLEDGPFEGSIPWQRFSWRVGLGPDGRLGEVEALPDERRVGEDFCWREGFGGSDRYFRICQTLDGPRASVFVERANGERTRAIPLTQVEAQAIASALVDPTRGWLYLWSPVDHGLSRIDLETGERRTLELDPDGPLLGDPIAGTDPGEARRPSGDPDPWRRPARALDPTGPTLVGSPDGARLYAAGGSIVDPFGAGSIGPLDQASTGIWVIDAERLTLLDRWLPETAIGSIGLTPDGRYLLGLGVPGIDRAGDRTSWGTTLTAIDTVSGGLAARYAAIPDGIQVIDPAR
jgi:hypothetical protein